MILCAHLAAQNKGAFWFTASRESYKQIYHANTGLLAKKMFRA